MELAKVTSKGQLTLPKEIRDKLSIKDGDKVIFFEKDGDIVVKNAAMVAIKNAQQAFAGEADRLGLHSVEDVAEMVKEVRKERASE